MNTVEPHVFIIMGALGDLTRRKLIPAIYRLSESGVLGDQHVVLGVDRDGNRDDASYRSWVREALRGADLKTDSEDAAHWCDRRIHYQSVGAGTDADYHALAQKAEALEREHELPGNRLINLALPLDAVAGTVAGLGKAGMNRSPGWTRLILEKPFGRSLASARSLNEAVHQHYDESQVYRIDHYLGKETVQNLLVFRFANAFVEHLWNREHVEQVQITVAEDIGIEERAAYYEHSGALRDMVQNHLTQLICLVAMEIPSGFTPEAVRYEKIKVLRQIAPIQPEDVVFGQYVGGSVHGEQVVGYREEDGVSPESDTETFAALKLEVANWRWKGVPFYLRTGKRMPRRHSEIVVYFEHAPVSIFHPGDSQAATKPNILVVRLQPDEGIGLQFQVKSVGDPVTLTSQELSFRYSDAFGALPDAYEHLLLDVATGDQMLFICDDEVEASWQLYDSMLADHRIKVHPYVAGSWGPAEMGRLCTQWHSPDP